MHWLVLFIFICYKRVIVQLNIFEIIILKFHAIFSVVYIFKEQLMCFDCFCNVSLFQVEDFSPVLTAYLHVSQIVWVVVECCAYKLLCL